ncbi:MAG: hypothetical protein LAO07_05145 [Acidobacteriia bacterium]|nr:hypothetical protein [Terriglobia bacterium]
MKQRFPAARLFLAPLFLAVAGGALSPSLRAKDKTPPIDPNDPTLRLYQLLDDTRGGKLADFYLIADVYKNPDNTDEDLQHILRVEYDKAHVFGKLNIYVRSISKIQPEQMKIYTAKEFYDFGLSDLEKFVKTEPGPFGKPADMYLRAGNDRPLATAPITDEVRKAYESFLTQYLSPALQKK